MSQDEIGAMESGIADSRKQLAEVATFLDCITLIAGIFFPG